MKTVNIHEAKTNLSRLLAQVQMGEEIIIANRGTPVARLSPYQEEKSTPREAGRLKGKAKIPEDFNQLDKESISLFEGHLD